MKETDYSVILTAVENELQEQEWSIEEYLDATAIKLAVANIYTTNDMCSGFGQDYNLQNYDSTSTKPPTLSIISSQQRISIITPDGMSFYKSDLPICGYEDVTVDIHYIMIVIQAVFDRISAQ